MTFASNFRMVLFKTVQKSLNYCLYPKWLIKVSIFDRKDRFVRDGMYI